MSAKILLVDDEAIIINVDRKLLKQLGYKVLIAKNGAAALKIFNARHQSIDLVLLDIIMPDLGGDEVYTEMKRLKPDVKVLVSSGYSIDWQARKMLEEGCSGFIQKPFKMKQLALQIRETHCKPGKIGSIFFQYFFFCFFQFLQLQIHSWMIHRASIILILALH